MSDDSRKLVFENREDRLRFMAVRATDVPTYVEYGCADIGVVGKDTLLEQGKDLYEPLDLKFGYCRLVVAEPKELQRTDDPGQLVQHPRRHQIPQYHRALFRRPRGAGGVDQALRLH
jgi:ATP phosphoribosyltransferase